ncbi:MAG TPA: SRPBCC family protein [Acidimicrobiales bacterium]|nr:SRPBCC family protein [Acidimicrobiales bacterium]
MDIEATLAIAAPPEVAYAALIDLGDWPTWNTLVQRVAVDRDGADDYAAWRVEFGAQIGVVRLTRHWRMVRVEAEPERFVRYERFELAGDGDHSDAVIEASLLDDGRWRLHLNYGGFLPIPGLVPYTRNEIARSLRRFNARLTATR